MMCPVKTVRFDLIPVSFSSTIRKSPFNHPRAAALRRCSISAASTMSEQQSNSSDTADSLSNYPVPLSPPLPANSKAIEQARAISASSISGCFSLARDHVIFEDEWLIAVNKPHGIYCESVLASAAQLAGEGDDAAKPERHLANRLDRDTSGIMLITKSHKVASKLVKAFTEHRVTKSYIALCVGKEPHWNKMTIKSGHGRSKFGAWRVYAASDIGRSLPGGSLVREMETSLQVLSVNGQPMNGDSSSTIVVEDKADLASVEGRRDEVLVRARPRSGRTHQIRLHCRFLGIPIIGDVKYEGVYEWKGEVHHFHALHAESLSLAHPMTGVNVTFQAPLPYWADPRLVD